MAISRYSENYCYDVIYDYNSFRQMSQDEMTIIILFRLDTILDGKFKPNSFNASWFQGEGFYCFLLVFCHFCCQFGTEYTFPQNDLKRYKVLLFL